MEQIPLLKLRQIPHSHSIIHLLAYLISHCCWSTGRETFGTWLISEVLSPWLVERYFNRNKWATTQASFSSWCGKLNIFLNKWKYSPRDVHWCRSQCLIPQGVVVSWLPPAAILFPLAARNIQQVYQDGIKYHSAVHLLKAFRWLLNIHIKISLQVVGGSLQLLWGVADFRILAPERKEDRQKAGLHLLPLR